MNREIKFRGKRKDNGEWVYGFGVDEYETMGGDRKAFLYTNQEEYMCVNKYEVDPETVGQCVGHGFWEGDIARTLGGSIGIIMWHESWHAFYFKQELGFNEYGKFVRMRSSVPLYNDLPKYERLGNMHDNPNLLQEETK